MARIVFATGLFTKEGAVNDFEASAQFGHPSHTLVEKI